MTFSAKFRPARQYITSRDAEGFWGWSKKFADAHHFKDRAEAKAAIRGMAPPEMSIGNYRNYEIRRIK